MDNMKGTNHGAVIAAAIVTLIATLVLSSCGVMPTTEARLIDRAKQVHAWWCQKPEERRLYYRRALNNGIQVNCDVRID